jgi:Protein of unknown function (DUF3309)
MSLGTILLIILIVILIGALPSWPYSSGWGYYPSGGIGLVLVIILILVCWAGSSDRRRRRAGEAGAASRHGTGVGFAGELSGAAAVARA